MVSSVAVLSDVHGVLPVLEAVPAVVLQKQCEPQRSRTPLTRQQLSILIQQGPEIDQFIWVIRSQLHAPQSFPPGHNHSPPPPLGLVTAPLPAPHFARNKIVGGHV